MSIAIQIPDDLYGQLKQRADDSGISIDKMVEKALRSEVQQEPFVQKTYAMGEPKVDLTKAMALSYATDEEIDALVEEAARQSAKAEATGEAK